MPRRLKPEEEALWRLVAQRTNPLRQARQSPDAAPSPRDSTASAQPPAPIPSFQIGAAAPDRSERHAVAGAAPAHPPLRMDRRTHARLTRGRIEPQARIDLHGMTLARAHPVLTRFILSSHAAGHRLVLVITGKGREDGGDGPIPERRGVLRRQAPEWLNAPPLDAIVQQVSPSHRRHGGSGAYYVWLRRR